MNGFLRWLVLVPAVLVFCGVKDVEACACVTREMSPEQNRQDVVEQLEKAIAVFSGEVMRLDALTVQFRLEDVWKGEFEEHVVMPINAGQNPDGTVAYSSCDYGFQVGRKYLVFAYGKSATTMPAYSCTRTIELQRATSTIELLDKIGRRARGDRKARWEMPKGRLTKPLQPTSGAGASNRFETTVSAARG